MVISHCLVDCLFWHLYCLFWYCYCLCKEELLDIHRCTQLVAYRFGRTLLVHGELGVLTCNKCYNIDLHLIPPWEYYNKLCPGTTVLCDVRLHLYQMAIMNTKGNQLKMRKVWEMCIPFITTLLTLKQRFKLNANTIRVVAKSDLPVEHWQQSVLPTSTSTSTTTCPLHSCLPDPRSNFCVLFNVADNDSHTLPQHQQPTTMLPASQLQYAEHLSHTEHTPSIGHEEKLEDILMKVDWEESDDEFYNPKNPRVNKEPIKNNGVLWTTNLPILISPSCLPDIIVSHPCALYHHSYNCLLLFLCSLLWL